MSKTIKMIIIVVATAVISLFVAMAVIPERSEFERQQAAERKHAAHARDIDARAEATAAAPAPATGNGNDTQKVLPAPQTQPVRQPTAPPADLAQLQTVQLQAVQLTPEAEPPRDADADARKTAPTPTPPPQTARATQTPPAPVAAAAPAPEPEQPAPPPPPPPRARGGELRVETAAVAANVVDRTPRGVSNRFSKNETNMIYFFTHITGARDTAAVVHRWYREDRLVQTSVLQVRSPNWRTHSRRNLTNIPNVPDPAGNWRVEAVDQRTGNVLSSATFVVE